MIRLLVTNGCSCTRGEELADPEVEAWPYRLATLLQVDVVNLAREGSSNRRIVRSTVDRVEDVCRTRAVPPGEVMTLIAWTQTSRHEYFSTREKPDLGPLPETYPSDARWQRIGPWRQDAGHKPSRAFYDHHWSDEGQLTNMFLDWLMLDAYLVARGFDARYAFAFPLTSSLPSQPSRFAAKLRRESVWGDIPPGPGSSFVEMPDEFERGPRGHPLARGHDWFAGRLAEWLTA
jgi:Family of unknown function (DUF6071)